MNSKLNYLFSDRDRLVAKQPCSARNSLYEYITNTTNKNI